MYLFVCLFFFVCFVVVVFCLFVSLVAHFGKQVCHMYPQCLNQIGQFLKNAPLTENNDPILKLTIDSYSIINVFVMQVVEKTKTPFL